MFLDSPDTRENIDLPRVWVEFDPLHRNASSPHALHGAREVALFEGCLLAHAAISLLCATPTAGAEDETTSVTENSFDGGQVVTHPLDQCLEALALENMR
jgi:hypothetical protein